MDDYGNQLHWTTTIHGQHSLALYGYAAGYGFIEVMAQGIDFSELNAPTIPCSRI